MRLSAYAVAGSTEVPLSVISCTFAPTRSTKVSAPGSLHVKRIVVVEPKVVSLVVRSRSMVYDSTARSRARVCASSRVRFVPGIRSSCHLCHSDFETAPTAM